MSDSTGTQITKASCLRIPRASFENFLQRTNKLRDMLTHAVNSSIEKQVKLRETCYVLIQKWMEEERRREQQKALTAPKLTGGGGGESLDVNKTRRLLKGALLT